ncbi:MAG TPA: serine hydrolase [Caulobacteraceae bacterium]|jgi:CubicO group peptidase (beta-lactamase class C family)
MSGTLDWSRRAFGLAAMGAAMAPALAARAEAAPLAAGLVDDVRRRFDVPGIAVALVEQGRPVLASGFGVRGLTDPRPVDAHTVFPIASNTKAFTSALLATLVDEGKLGWDGHVVDYLPGFQMWDEWVTREMTVRDLLVHRSGLGLGEGDLMLFPKTTFTPKELVAHLRWLKPKTSFRSTYAYDNVLYEAVAVLVEAVTGQSWSDALRQRILGPVGMTDAVIGESAFFAAPDHALPHAKIDASDRGAGKLSVLTTTNVGDVLLSAGGLAASAADLSRWLMTQVNGGLAPDGKRVFTEAQGAQMWKPQTLIPPSDIGAAGWPQPQYRAYALGWEVADIDGLMMVRHGGYVQGFKSYTVVIPSQKTGFVVLTNAEEGYGISAIALSLLDHYQGRPARDRVSQLLAARDADRAETLAAGAGIPRDPGARPTLQLSAYAGVYRDAWYGTTTLTMRDGGLWMRFDRTPGMEGPLEPWRYDTFRTRWKLPGVEDAFVTFALTPEGGVRDMTMRAVSPLADFSFDYQDLLFRPAAAG